VCSGRHQLDAGLTVDEAMLELEKVAEEHGLTRLGSSDAHTIGEIGIVTTVMPAETLEDLRAAVFNGPTVVKHRGSSKFKKIFFGI
jgi:hypothetical protein